MKRIDLVIIDGQNDFLDPNGALYVTGADLEAKKLAGMIRRTIRKITKLHATLDSHHNMDIAHPQMWKDENGNHPNPFTIISADDVRNGKWTCTLLGYYNPEKKITFREKTLAYVEQLEKNNRYPLCIWPPHCLIGTKGANVYPELYSAYEEWIKENRSWVNFVTKGDFPFTEHYSAIQADVPEPGLIKTQLNTELLKDIGNADMIVWAGWAGSHCLANTGRDAMEYFNKISDEFIKKSVLLTDACAPVGDLPGSTMFADMRTKFIDDMKSQGMQMSTTDTFLT